MTSRSLWLIAALATLSAGPAAQTNAARTQMEAARKAEIVDGDLKRAIAQYSAIIDKFKADRAVVADALVHMAECYQKLGDAESKRIYERIIRDYSDQREAAAIARAHVTTVEASAGAGLSTGLVSRQVWSGPEVDTYGSVSPDGRYISFIAPARFRRIPVTDVAPSALGLHDLRNGSNRQIAGPDEGAEGSVISKDGKLIVYTGFDARQVRYHLRLANVEGNPNPRLLFDNPDVDWIGAYDWSPDNRSVVVLVKRKDHTAQIGFVSIPDGSLRILKSVDWRGTGRIFLSPDGRYIGYDLPASDTNREHDVFVLNADATRETVAVKHPSLNFMMGWSADAKWLVFASNRNGSMSVWAAPFLDGRVQGTPELVRPNIGPGEPMGITRSGSFYYGMWSNSRQTSNIRVASLEPAGRILTTIAVPKEAVASDTQPAWSPNGDLLAYVSDRGVSGSSIEQSGQRMLALVIRSSETARVVQEFDLNLNTGGSVRLLRWTWDGTALLFKGIDNKGRTGLFQVDAHTGAMSTVGFVRLKPGGEWDDGNWKVSATAATLYAQRSLCPLHVDSTDVRCAVGAFFKRDLASGVETELIRGYRLGALNLSPNDENIATGIPDPATNSRTFAVISTNGGQPRELMRVATGNADRETGPNGKGRGLEFMGWTPDSRSVFIRETLDAEPVAVWRASLDGAAPQKLDWSADQIQAIGTIAVDLHGTKIAYTPRAAPRSGASANEVWALENFLPKPSASRQSPGK
jgi:Tol biopolymer transport system component